MGQTAPTCQLRKSTRRSRTVVTSENISVSVQTQRDLSQAGSGVSTVVGSLEVAISSIEVWNNYCESRLREFSHRH